MTSDLRSHFAIHTTPFTREISVAERFALDQFAEVTTALRHCIEQRMSAALIAPAGTGKTATVRALCAELPEARYDVHYVKVTHLSKRDMCREITAAMGVAPAGSYPFLVRRIQERLQTASGDDGRRPVLVIDEAHDLRAEVLGMLRVLTNFEMDSRLVVSVLLVGQPPLRTLLRRDTLEDVARRLAHIAALRPLSRAETGRYLEHRMTIAGATTSPFDAATVEAIYEVGHGNLRATDRLALKSLELAWREGVTTVSTNHAIEARKLLWP